MQLAAWHLGFQKQHNINFLNEPFIFHTEESPQELLVVASLYTNLGVIFSKMNLLSEVSAIYILFDFVTVVCFNRLQLLYRELQRYTSHCQILIHLKLGQLCTSQPSCTKAGENMCKAIIARWNCSILNCCCYIYSFSALLNPC